MFERVAREAMRAGYLAAKRNAARGQGIYAEDDESDWLMAPPSPAEAVPPKRAEAAARPGDRRSAPGPRPATPDPAPVALRPVSAMPPPAAGAAPVAPPSPAPKEGRADGPSEAALATAVRLIGPGRACAKERGAVVRELDPGAPFSRAYGAFIRLMCPHAGRPELDAARRTPWTAGTARDAETAMQLFVELVGDKPVRSYTMFDLVAFRGRLSELPVRWNRDEFADLGATGAIAKADVLEAAALEAVDARYDAGEIEGEDYEEARQQARIERLSKKTQNKHLDLVARLFKTMHLAGALPVNPSLGVRHPKHEVSRSARAERERWTGDEVRRLLQSPLITGKGTYRLLRGDLAHDPEAYWLTLLLAYAGMRPEEAAQLEVGDFGALEGIHCIVIRPSNGRRVKNNASIRVLPVPTVLIQLGLLRLVEERRAAGGRQLFATLTRARGQARKNATSPVNRIRNMSDPVLKRLRDYIRNRPELAGIAKVPSGLRHSCQHELGNTDSPTRRIDELAGHVLTGETLGRYFKGSTLRSLKEAIDRLDYGVRLVPDDDGTMRIAAAGAPAPTGRDPTVVAFPGPARPRRAARRVLERPSGVPGADARPGDDAGPL